jgi:hypothetical protein
MRSASLLGPVLAILAATACSSISTVPATQPAPAVARTSSASSSTAATLGIPPGHLPPPGLCRVWMPGTPPGHQAPSRNCANIERTAPAGSWILYRPGKDRKIVQVQVVDARRAGVIVHRRVYSVQRGTLISES